MHTTTYEEKEVSVTKTMEKLAAHGFIPQQVATKEEALEKVKALIPKGVSLNNGASQTLAEIGFIDLLKSGTHSWINLHDAILAETDPVKQALLRRQSVVSDFYIGSAHAVTEGGDILVSSNSGSQLPHLAYTSPNIILVVSVKKIVPTLGDAFARISEHVVPLEDARMHEAYGYGTLLAKTLVLHRENPAIGRKVHVLFVDEALGF